MEAGQIELYSMFWLVIIPCTKRYHASPMRIVRHVHPDGESIVHSRDIRSRVHPAVQTPRPVLTAAVTTEGTVSVF
jgi:hypothetical protein